MSNKTITLYREPCTTDQAEQQIKMLTIINYRINKKQKENTTKCGLSSRVIPTTKGTVHDLMEKKKLNKAYWNRAIKLS